MLSEMMANEMQIIRFDNDLKGVIFYGCLSSLYARSFSTNER